MGFDGWPRGAVTFLKELEANNDRDWFKANRARYDELLLAPAQELARALERRHGKPVFFRPYRDTRFSPGPPIREHVAFKLGEVYTGGGYVEISLDGLLVGSGVMMTMPDQIERWRRAVADPRTGPAVERLLAKAAAGGMTLHEPELKRVPRGYPVDHPRAELLKAKRFAVMRRDKLGPWVHTPECGARIAAALDAARPFTHWLRERIGPSEMDRRRR
jgi:uncharacterized protein (TIGR02453 family)